MRINSYLIGQKYLQSQQQTCFMKVSAVQTQVDSSSLLNQNQKRQQDYQKEIIIKLIGHFNSSDSEIGRISIFIRFLLFKLGDFQITPDLGMKSNLENIINYSHLRNENQLYIKEAVDHPFKFVKSWVSKAQKQKSLRNDQKLYEIFQKSLISKQVFVLLDRNFLNYLIYGELDISKVDYVILNEVHNLYPESTYVGIMNKFIFNRKQMLSSAQNPVQLEDQRNLPKVLAFFSLDSVLQGTQNHDSQIMAKYHFMANAFDGFLLCLEKQDLVKVERDIVREFSLSRVRNIKGISHLAHQVQNTLEFLQKARKYLSFRRDGKTHVACLPESIVQKKQLHAYQFLETKYAKITLDEAMSILQQLGAKFPEYLKNQKTDKHSNVYKPTIESAQWVFKKVTYFSSRILFDEPLVQLLGRDNVKYYASQISIPSQRDKSGDYPFWLYSPRIYLKKSQSESQAALEMCKILFSQGYLDKYLRPQIIRQSEILEIYDSNTTNRRDYNSSQPTSHQQQDEEDKISINGHSQLVRATDQQSAQSPNIPNHSAQDRVSSITHGETQSIYLMQSRNLQMNHDNLQMNHDFAQIFPREEQNERKEDDSQSHESDISISTSLICNSSNCRQSDIHQPAQEKLLLLDDSSLVFIEEYQYEADEFQNFDAISAYITAKTDEEMNTGEQEIVEDIFDETTEPNQSRDEVFQRGYQEPIQQDHEFKNQEIKLRGIEARSLVFSIDEKHLLIMQYNIQFLKYLQDSILMYNLSKQFMCKMSDGSIYIIGQMGKLKFRRLKYSKEPNMKALLFYYGMRLYLDDAYKEFEFQFVQHRKEDRERDSSINDLWLQFYNHYRNPQKVKVRSADQKRYPAINEDAKKLFYLVQSAAENFSAREIEKIDWMQDYIIQCLNDRCHTIGANPQSSLLVIESQRVQNLRIRELLQRCDMKFIDGLSYDMKDIGNFVQKFDNRQVQQFCEHLIQFGKA